MLSRLPTTLGLLRHDFGDFDHVKPHLGLWYSSFDHDCADHGPPDLGSFYLCLDATPGDA